MREAESSSAIAKVGAGGPDGPTQSWSAQAGDQALRLVVSLAGLGLLVGFFLPWLRFGDVAAVSGLSLMVSLAAVALAMTGVSTGRMKPR